VNTLATLADRSDAPDPGWWVLLAIAAIGFLIWLVFRIVETTAAKDLAAEAEEPPAENHAAKCALRCGAEGTIARRERSDLGGQRVLVCPGHSDEGDRKGWWAA
jgi:hypothetical protein